MSLAKALAAIYLRTGIGWFQSGTRRIVTLREFAGGTSASALEKIPPGQYDIQETALDPAGQKAARWQVPIMPIP